MKNIVKLFFILAFTTFIFSSCGENALSSITDPQQSSQEMAILSGENWFTVISQTGDSPPVSERVQSVEWDGVSPLEPGVVYSNMTLENMKKASALMGHPAWFEAYISLREFTSSEEFRNADEAERQRMLDEYIAE